MPQFLYLIRKKAMMITAGIKKFLRIYEFMAFMAFMVFMVFMVVMDISDFFC